MVIGFATPYGTDEKNHNGLVLNTHSDGRRGDAGVGNMEEAGERGFHLVTRTISESERRSIGLAAPELILMLALLNSL